MAKNKGATSSIADLLSGGINKAFSIDNNRNATDNQTASKESASPNNDEANLEEGAEETTSATAEGEETVEGVEGEEGVEEGSTPNADLDSQEYVINETVKVGDKESKVIYSDVEALKIGAVEKEKMILKQNAELERERDKRVEAEAKLRSAASGPQESDRTKFIQDSLPKEFQGKTSEDFESVAELREFTKAEAKAEAAWDNQLQEAQRLRTEIEKAQVKLIKEAQDLVAGELSSRESTILNSEGKAAFKEALATEVQIAEGQSITYGDVAIMMAEVDHNIARLFLDGVQKQLNGETSKKVGKVVEIGAKSKTAPRQQASAPSGTPRTQLRGRKAIAQTLSMGKKK